MDAAKWLLARTERFPKRLRHSLTERIDLLAVGILEDVTSAAYRKDPRPDLGSANDKLNRLRVLLRLAHEMKVLSHDQYREGAERLAEAGRLLGGWLRKGKTSGSDPEAADV
ncbi:MAG: four helix bundle protein [Deltaproteobacteria bacterium]|nr:four helix bundle protein [Deltaproteobacteria bacterium]